MSPGFLPILLSCGLYGVVHSLLASHGAKRLAYRLTGEASCRFYRLAYNIFAVLSLLPVLALLVALPDAPLYHLAAPWSLIVRGLQGASVLALVYTLLQTNLPDFAGLAQLFSSPRAGTLTGCPPGGPLPESLRATLVTRGIYRYVRHPLYTFGLLALWLSPRLSWNGLALNLGLTLYILAGALLEERKLLAEYGPAYAAYRARTPMLLPIRLFKRKE